MEDQVPDRIKTKQKNMKNKDIKEPSIPKLGI